MRCSKAENCMYFQKKIQINEHQWDVDYHKHCESDFTNCAIYQAMSNVSTSKIPKDLQPSQSFRILELIK